MDPVLPASPTRNPLNTLNTHRISSVKAWSGFFPHNFPCQFIRPPWGLDWGLHCDPVYLPQWQLRSNHSTD
ncbi:hypothetical protein M404DRAFT_247043 [Pisolithus tinctorius Marx 270]|uniref:Uncharacterized protein n=1 Tax=Pisolithus tinctorius Marx 270 TaxID=870435 RepID=A0A0C3JFC9_PISTI|nr:hypothetical protein M404DRAFT_247043 [Pisolithus tinctorius Marx 270]